MNCVVKCFSLGSEGGDLDPPLPVCRRVVKIVRVDRRDGRADAAISALRCCEGVDHGDEFEM